MPSASIADRRRRHAKRRVATSCARLKQARLVKFQRDGKNVIYALSDDHVYTMLAQGMTHICE